MAGKSWGSGPSSFGVPQQPGRPKGSDDGGEENPNKYRRRLEDIDPAHTDPSAMVEHHEPLRARPSPYTVEGYIQGFADLSEAAINGTGQRRDRARFLVIMSLTAILTPVAILLLGIFDLF
jgi:hypothetical protein